VSAKTRYIAQFRCDSTAHVMLQILYLCVIASIEKDGYELKSSTLSWFSAFKAI